MTENEKAHDEMMQSWIEDGYKISQYLGDIRKQDYEESKKKGVFTCPEIPLEEID
jgi:hypothetical protein